MAVYAKQLADGKGFSVIGLDCPVYTTATLKNGTDANTNGNPNGNLRCERTGQRLFVNPEAHDHCIKVIARSQQVYDLFEQKVRQTWNELKSDLKATLDDWREAPDDTEADAKALIEMQAQHLAFCGAVEFFDRVGVEYGGQVRAIAGMMEQDIKDKFLDDKEWKGQNDRQNVGTNPIHNLMRRVFGQNVQVIDLTELAGEDGPSARISGQRGSRIEDDATVKVG